MPTTPHGTSTGGRPTRATTDPAERAAWLALAAIRGLGARRLAALVRHAGSARAVFEASPSDLAALDGFTRRAAARILRARPPADHAAADPPGETLLIPPDPGYPARLRAIPDPPPLLHCRGALDLLARDAIAIVGSRDHTRYGARVARGLGEVAVAAGLVVVSGMARGLDAVAQSAALDAGGGTIGVLATGVDVVYPRQNAALFARVLERGALLSEAPPGRRVEPGAFARRNRIISGLARAVVVVEATEASGTMLTVAAALEQGREVLAVPGPIDAPTSRGTNRLLRDGATPLLDPAELPGLLGLAAPPRTRAPVPTGTPEEARALGALDHEGRHVDEVALRAGLPVGTLLGALLGLELAGLVEQLPGGEFRRR